jgi:hypothetical protein
MAMGASAALNAAKRSGVIVIGFDGSNDGRDAIMHAIFARRCCNRPRWRPPKPSTKPAKRRI